MNKDNLSRGIIQIKSESPYHRILSSFTFVEWDIVGFYQGRKLILYDVYTGKEVSLDDTTIDITEKVMGYSTYKVTPFYTKTFDGVIRRLRNQRQDKLHPKIKMETTRKALNRVVLHLFGNEDMIEYPGIKKVNMAIRAIDMDIIASSESESKFISYSRLYGEEVIHNRTNTPISNYHDQDFSILCEVFSSLANHNTELRQRLLRYIPEQMVEFRVTMNTDTVKSDIIDNTSNDNEKLEHIYLNVPEDEFIVSNDILDSMVSLEDSLIEIASKNSNNSNKLEAIVQKINKLRLITNHKIASVNPSTRKEDISTDLDLIGGKMRSILNAIKDGSCPVVDISSMALSFNKIAITEDIETVNITEDYDHGSYSSIVVLRTQETVYNKIKIPIPNDDVIILPSMGGDFSLLDTEVIKESLNYLDSLPDKDSRFLVLKMSLIRELSDRNISGHIK